MTMLADILRILANKLCCEQYMGVIMDIIRFIQGFSNPFLDLIFQLITMMGEDSFFIFVVAIFYWCINKEIGYKLAFASISSTVLNVSLKEVFAVPRPIGEPGIRSLRLETATGYSFPSGHTQSTATFWSFMMLQFRKRWLVLLGAFMILLVAISRMYLGVHTPLDVTGGALIGAVWVLVWNYIYELSRKHNNKLILLVVLIPALLGLTVFKNNDYYKASGAFLGLFIGYLAEPRFIRFKVEAGPLVQFAKLTLGLSVALAIRIVLKAALPEVLLSDFIRYFIIIIWISIAAPLVFKSFIKNM